MCVCVTQGSLKIFFKKIENDKRAQFGVAARGWAWLYRVMRLEMSQKPNQKGLSHWALQFAFCIC